MDNNQNEKMNNEFELEPEITETEQVTEEVVPADERDKANNRKKTITIIIICLIGVLLILAVGALFFLRGSIRGTQSEPDANSGYVVDAKDEEQAYADFLASIKKKNSSKKKNPSKVSSIQEETDKGAAEATSNSSPNQSDVVLEQSDEPNVTIAAEVASGLCIVGGSCPENTEYVTVKGEGITETKIFPYPGEDDEYAYFIGQVKFSKSTYVQVTATEKGKRESKADQKYVGFTDFKGNYMTESEYHPVIGLNSRAHFYSALLCHTLTTKKFNDTMRANAKTNIERLVSEANSVGAETIFLIIPSTTEIYPETIPEGYPKANGETIFQAFEKIVAPTGAKIIYPKERMLSHKNDGKGYQLYQYTDSHWSPYGAYWGTYDLFEYIAQKYPAARPRTVEEMNFYTIELNAGDAIFNLKDTKNDKYLESDRGSGVTTNTDMREFTNLYYNNTKTLENIYHGATGLYLSEYNAASKIVENIMPDGLPNAVIMRDSFGKVAYDMISDRFATAYWGQFDNYNLPDNWKDTKPNYVIHLYSERNLLKLMLSDSSYSLLTLQ